MSAAEEQEIFTLLSGKNASDQPIFSVLVKRTYDILPEQKAIRAKETFPLVQEDRYYEHGDPEWATVKYETDLVPFKLQTDVVVIGKAFAPSGEVVTALEAAVAVGSHQKKVRVTGDRYSYHRSWLRQPGFTDPVPFKAKAIRYENAYGGNDEKSDPKIPFSYPRNPLGKGVVLKGTRERLEGLALPNIEAPDDLLTPERLVLGKPERWNEQPLPAGFGWYQRTWYPRSSFVGSMPSFLDIDTVMREETLGLVPEGQVALSRQFKLPSFDTRFNNGASIGLVVPYLKGDEPVRLIQLTPDGTLTFSLPGDPPNISLDIGLGETALDAILHTVCIRLKEAQVDLVWRGALEYPGPDWLPEMKKLVTRIG